MLKCQNMNKMVSFYFILNVLYLNTLKEAFDCIFLFDVNISLFIFFQKLDLLRGRIFPLYKTGMNKEN